MSDGIIDAAVQAGPGMTGLTMKTLMMLVGVIAIAAGLLWAGQGAGYVSWPSDSFMLNDIRWLYYGLVTAVGGAALILMARRRA